SDLTLPPRRSRPPNASAYAVTTHCRSASDAPRADWAEGSAMLTMVASSAIISWAIAMKASAVHLLLSGGGAVQVCVSAVAALMSGEPRAAPRHPPWRRGPPRTLLQRSRPRHPA